MSHTLELLQENVNILRHASYIEKETRGYSQDEKYIVHSLNEKYLLRVGALNDYEKKKAEFQILKKLQSINVKCPEPIEFGKHTESGICYNIYSFIDGRDGKEVLHELTSKEQYKFGAEAGAQLSRMHSLKAPLTLESWYERAMAKHYRYLEAYKTCDIHIKSDNKIIDFIEKNKSLLKERPNYFQHDDFHLGNIIVHNNKYAGAIDFESIDWGDPIHDFVKVALFQRELSVSFSIGQIKGYFIEGVPEKFWILYSIYNAMVIFSSVVWTLRFSPDQLEEMMERIHNILEDHKDFEKLKPSWFD